MFTVDSGGGALGPPLSSLWAQAPAVIIVTAISTAINLPVFIALTMTSNLCLSIGQSVCQTVGFDYLPYFQWFEKTRLRIDFLLPGGFQPTQRWI